jgi:hypothetical protein
MRRHRRSNGFDLGDIRHQPVHFPVSGDQFAHFKLSSSFVCLILWR